MQQSSAGRRIALIAALVSLAIAGGVVGVAAWTAGGSHVGSHPLIQWDSLAPPVVADVDHDGVEDVIGLIRVIHHHGTDQSYVAAYSGRDFHQLWKDGSFGDTSDAANRTHLAVAGSTVLVSDYRHLLHAYDLATGKPGFQIWLSDRADRLCASPDGKSVWVAVADKQDRLVDIASEHAKAAPRPTWCRAQPSDSSGCSFVEFQNRVQGRARCESPKKKHRRGLNIDYILADGHVRVGLGVKSPGTEVPIAVGLGAGGAITWRRAIPQVDLVQAKTGAVELADLADGLLIAQYLTGKGFGKPRLVAIDASTGAVRWDVAVPHTPHGTAADVMTVSDHRIYLPHWTSLDIFDLATGRHLKSIGQF